MNTILHTEVLLSEKEAVLNSYRLYDADWKDKYGLVLLVKRKQKIFILWDGSSSEIPVNMSYPTVRWVDKERILLIDTRNDADRQNAFILKKDGSIYSSFNVGDGIADAVIGAEGIWISYFDEGIFKEEGFSTEGLVLFDFEGNSVFSYHSDLPEAPFISDCYGLVKGKGAAIWLFPYTEFPLVQVDAGNFTSYEVPEGLHSSTAISVRGNIAYFVKGAGSEEVLYRWEIGNTQIQSIGKGQGQLRGLGPQESGQFLSVCHSKNEVLLYTIPDEQNYQ